MKQMTIFDIVPDEYAGAAAAERESRYIEVPLTAEQELCLAELNAKEK